MSTDPFKARAATPRLNKALVLTQSKLNELILNSKSGQDEEEGEKARLEERRQRQEATKALSKLILQGKQLGSDLRKRQYEQDVKNAQKDLERETRIEVRRNNVLDQAYKRLYEETDRVKYFKSAKNLSEMLKQRGMQIEAQSKMKNLFSQSDKEFLLGMIRDLDNYEKEETGKIEKVRQDKKKNAENWTKQLNEVQCKKNQEEWEHIRDGHVIREAAQNYAQELRNAELKQRMRAEEHKQMLHKQREEKLALFELHAKLDEADEKRAEIFNVAKRDMKMKHKEIRDELDAKKELKRQYVANNLIDESASRKIKEDAILQKAILQSDAKHKEGCAMKQAKREAALKSIQEFYEREMEAKAKRELEEKRRGFQEKRKIMEHVEDQLKAEDTKMERKKKSERETEHLLLHQIAKREMDKCQEKLEDVKDYLNHMRSLNDEEEIFQKYAQIEIEDCEKRGIDTKPMRFAARPGVECGRGPLYKDRGPIRPRYYAAKSEGDELNHIERDMKTPDTKARLGFMLH